MKNEFKAAKVWELTKQRAALQALISIGRPQQVGESSLFCAEEQRQALEHAEHINCEHSASLKSLTISDTFQSETRGSL